MACLAKSSDEPWLGDFARALYRVNFAEDREIGEVAVIRSILDSLRLPGAQNLERAGRQEVKALLREQTRWAVELGIFGALSFVVGDELFWPTTAWKTPCSGQVLVPTRASAATDDKGGRTGHAD